MRSSIALFALALFVSCVSTHVEAFPSGRMEIPSVAFDDLVRGSGNDHGSSERLRQAMLEDGILTVHGIPDFADLRRRVMSGVAACGAISPAARVTNFPDGTARRTIAAVTKGFDSLHAADLDGDSAETCSEELFADVKTFREIVSTVSRAFVQRLAEQFPTEDGSPLLQSAEDGASFRDVPALVAAGDHLEHFHAYSSGGSSARQGNERAKQETVDMHADQGMFIVFTPGVVVDLTLQPPATVAEASPGSFFLERRDGSVVEADFSRGDDVLAVMLGDGVDAIVNPRMPDGVNLRAAPHGMKMPDLGDSAGRVRAWYGRMFLPPSSAMHAESGVSYGEARARTIDSVRAGEGESAPGVGCSRRGLSAADTTCADPNDMYCWMRCMPKVDCAETGAEVKCASQRDEIWRPVDSHGDYNPTCTNSVLNVTTDPLMPAEYKDAPAGGCVTPFVEYLAEPGPSGEAWPNQHELVKDALYLQWRRCASTVGALEMRMVYKGSVGYLAIGMKNHGGLHNGMNGAPIVMGVYDPDEEAHGGEHWLNYVGTGVKERKIHETLSAFRHWKDAYPEEPGLMNASMEVNPGCGSAMYFKTKTIYGEFLNVTKCSSNDLIWAVHTETLLKGYHGFATRGHLKVDFCVDVGVVDWVNPFADASRAAGSRQSGFFAMLALTAVCFLL